MACRRLVRWFPIATNTHRFATHSVVRHSLCTSRFTLVLRRTVVSFPSFHAEAAAVELFSPALRRALQLDTRTVDDSKWDTRVLESSVASATTVSNHTDTSVVETAWDDATIPRTSRPTSDTRSATTTTRSSTKQDLESALTTTAFPWIEERQWRLDTTTRLLTAPVGAWTMEDWLVVEDLLVQGWSRLDCIRSVVIQFPLLERCWREHERLLQPLPSGVETKDANANVLDTKESLRNQIERWLHLHLLNDMVESWRLVYTVHASTLTACELAPDQLRRYVRHTLHETLGLPLDAKTFYYIAEAAMSQPSRHGTPEFVTGVLEDTLDVYQSSGRDEACFPRAPLWNLCLTAWVQANRGSASTNAVWKLWSRMDEVGAVRSKRTYLTALVACGLERSEAAARRAETLLQRMYSEYRDKRNSGSDGTTNSGMRNTLQPDVYCFTAVVDAWAKSKSPLAGPRAEQIYQQMMVLRQQDELFGYRKADTTLINCALMCWSHATTPDAIDQAEAFWRQSQVAPDSVTYTTLMKLYAERGNLAAVERLWSELDTATDVDGQPMVWEVSLYTTMLHMYAKSKLENRLALATRVVEKMKQSPHVQPNTKAYNAYLLVLSSYPTTSAKLTAQAFIEEMKDLYQSGQPTRPDFVSYSTVMNAWAKQGHPERASQVLRLMYDDYLAGNETAKPDVQSFNTILASYIKCKDRDAPARAELFLQHMMKIETDGVLDLHLDVYSWSSFLACLSNSQDNRPAAAAKAEDVLHTMRQSYAKGNDRVRPNSYCYNSVMDCWARASLAERAEAVFLSMCEDYRNGNESAKPQTTTFNILLKAWAFSKHARAAERGEEILLQMHELTQSGAMHVPPNVITYTTLLTCYGLSKQPGAPQRAQHIVQQMDELFSTGAIPEGPNETTFRTLRKAWMYSREPNREEALSTIDREMKKRFGKGMKSSRRA